MPCAVAGALHIHRIVGSVVGCSCSWLRLSLATKSKSSQADQYLTTSSIESSRSRQVIPWLILSKNEARYVYDFAVQEKITRHLPKISMDLHYNMGSSEGFLFSVDVTSSEIQATNPLTGSHIPLPSTTTLPNIVSLIRNSFEKVTGYVIDNSFVKHKMEPYIYEDNKGKGNTTTFPFERIMHSPITTIGINSITYKKAILSPSLDTAVVIYRLGPKSAHKLAFARVGESTPPPSSWTALHSPHHNDYSDSARFHDIIFHHGRLHALDSDSNLTIFDLDNDPLETTLPSFRSPLIPFPFQFKELEDINVDQRYLVESPNGSDLFLVYRGIQYSSSSSSSSSSSDTIPPLRTKTFKVFKLEKDCDYMWEPVETIGDLAFFLGDNHSLSLSVPPPLLKPNSIYFTDTHPRTGFDTGVFYLEDGSFHFYQLNERSGINQFDWSRPVWLMPSST